MIGRLRGGGFAFRFVGRARLWFTISGLVLLVSVGSIALRGFNAGIDFTGGTALEVQARAADVSVRDVRRAIAAVGVEEATIQEVGDGGFLVQMAHLAVDEQRVAVEALAEVTEVDVDEVNVTDVGPKWGQQITNQAVRALLIFLVVAVLYISIRLEPKMAGAAMVALVHDLLVTAGIYSLTGFVVTPASVIAFLTVLGYSLYDTVVIFDRVKERTATLSASGSVTYAQGVDEAVNQVLVRSLNTSITSLLPVGSLLFVGSFLLGAQTLRELALALFIGLSAGTYSSVFVATPVVALWKEREDRWSTLRARIAARTGAVAETPTAAPPPPPPPPRPPAPTPQQRPAPTQTATASEEPEETGSSATTPSRPKGLSSQPKGAPSRKKRRKKRKRKKRR